MLGFSSKHISNSFFFLCVPGSNFYRLFISSAKPGRLSLPPLAPRTASILSGLSCQNNLLSTQFDTCKRNRIQIRKSSIDAGCRPILGCWFIADTPGNTPGYLLFASPWVSLAVTHDCYLLDKLTVLCVVYSCTLLTGV